MRRFIAMLITLAACRVALSTAGARAQTISDLFDETQLHDVWINLDPRDWKTLKANFLEDAYYRADFRWHEQYFAGAGIRSRGGGSRSGVKPSLRVDFERYQKRGRMLGLSSLVLRNLLQDPPFCNEHLSMLLLRRLNLPAPRTAHARLYVNNEYAGLYLLVEEVDARFARERFSGDPGALYKYEWTEPYFFTYRGPDPKAYCPSPFKPVTDEDPSANAALASLFRAVNLAPDEEFVSAVSRHLDLNSFVAQLAADNFLGEYDGLLSENGVTNFYLYRRPGHGLFHFLPWDKNATLMDAEHPVFWRVEENVLARRALAVPGLRRQYLAGMQKCAEAAGQEGGWLEQQAWFAYHNIRASVLEDRYKPETDEAFQASFDVLLHVARSRSASVLRQVEEYQRLLASTGTE